MTVDEFLRELRRHGAGTVLTFIERNYPFLHDKGQWVCERIQTMRDPGPAERTAHYWLTILKATQGSVVAENAATPTLTPFGRALARYLVLSALGAAPAEPAVRPADAELTRLDFELWGQAAADNPQHFHALLLGRLTRAALWFAPDTRSRAAQSIAVTALLLTEHLSRTGNAEERRDFDREAVLLAAAAATCFTPSEMAGQRAAAREAYRQLPERRRSNGW